MEFEERSIKVVIDEQKCQGCTTHVCVEACKFYDRGILELIDGKPGVSLSPDDLKRMGTECLSCEYECWFRGNGAIRIEIFMPGLEDYRRKHATV